MAGESYPSRGGEEKNSFRKLRAGPENMLLAYCCFGSAGNLIYRFEYVCVFRNRCSGISFEPAPLQRIAAGACYNRAYLFDNTKRNEGIMGK